MTARPAPSQILFGRTSVVAGALALIGVAVVPLIQGRLELCFFRPALLDHPCPGCGLLRSMNALVRGELADSLHYHPFGLLFLPLAVLMASVPLWPRVFSSWLRARLDARPRGFARWHHAGIIVFVVFGAVRLVLSGFGLWPRL